MPKAPIEMSRHGFSVAYEGVAGSAVHEIDVDNLAPALLAFGRLIREANAEFNGKRATAKVLVVSDFERKCFNINFDVVLGFYEQIKTILASSDAVTAKAILDWVGVAKAAGGLSFLAFLRWRKGRKIIEATDADKSGKVTVRVEGDHNVVNVVDARVYQLAQNPKALRATRDAFLPVGQDGLIQCALLTGRM